MVKAIILISLSILAWFSSLVSAIPMTDIDSNKSKSSLSKDFGRQRKTERFEKSLTPSQTKKMLEETREQHRLFDIRERGRQKVKDQGGLTEAQQKRVDQNHAKIQQRIKWKIGF